MHTERYNAIEKLRVRGEIITEEQKEQRKIVEYYETLYTETENWKDHN